MDNPILSAPNYGEESYQIEEFLELKQRNNFIKCVERMVRTSVEYKKWRDFVRGALSDKFVCYKTGESSDSCSIELHHHPFTLFEIVLTSLDTFKTFSSFDIATYVMKLHFENKVGFIPLSVTSHEKFHNKFIGIPIDIVEGDWESFTNTYTLDEHLITKLQSNISINLTNCMDDWYMKSKNYLLEDDNNDSGF